MRFPTILMAAFLFGTVAQDADHDPLRAAAAESLVRAVAFFRSEVAVRGTYLWQYSSDLEKREGEGKASATQGWVQPPGTPRVGMALLDAWLATSNRACLDAARDTAHGLIQGQMRSGGWHYAVDFDPAARKRIAYRFGGAAERGKNVTTFDDDTTQAALRFLMRFDEVTRFADKAVRESVEFAVVSILQAQYPIGAWPQGYETFPDPTKYPVNPASFPDSWPREWPGSQQYWLRYTLNDNSTATILDTLFEIERIYGAPSAGEKWNELARRARAAVDRTGQFLLLSQMPEPQPAWAQQYDFEMHPSWARKFEPPAVTGGESQGVLRSLLKLYLATGDKRYLEPVPRALAYLKRSRLPDGQLARFYELRSNKPLYFTRDYKLTYQDNDMPTHYAFKVSDGTARIERDYERARTVSLNQLRAEAAARKSDRPTAAEVRDLIAAQDSRGAWVEESRLRYHGSADDTTRVIRSATFVRNVETLAGFLAPR